MKLLVIEDERRIADSIKKGLEQEHFAVDVAYEGATGYDLASTEEYDSIILDRMLPEKDGMEICTELRQHENHTPILMLTAKSQINDKVEGLNCGADDYLSKPFSFEELVARVRALTRRPKNAVGTVLQVEDVTLDTVSQQTKRGKTEIQLSHREYTLLEYFLRNKNRVLSKDQIIANVWSFESDVLPNTVEVTVRNLRNKLQKPFPKKREIIETIRGFGYKITDHT